MASGRRTCLLVVAAVVALLGFAGYRLGWHWWGAHHREAAQAALERRDFRQAADHAEQALKVRPTDPALRLLAAQAARRQGDFDRALPHLHAAQGIPEVAEAVALEYRLWPVQNGDLTTAQSLFYRADEKPQAPAAPLILEALIEGSLKMLAGLAGMGFTRTDLENQPEFAMGRQAIETWLQQRPGQVDQAQGHVWRGRVHASSNEHALAVADFRRAVELAPDAFQPRLQLAMTIGEEAPEETADHLAVLVRRYPENTQVRFLLALGRRGSGRLDEAQHLLDELLAANPTDLPVLVERGKLALDAEKPREAEEWLRRAEAIAPDSPDVCLALARTMRLLGDAGQAERYHVQFEQLEAAQKRRHEETLAKMKAMRKNVTREQWK
jgi:tetratricopeptide (TPR) repeat protein